MIEWFFTETIYGLAVLALPIYGVAIVLKKVVPKAPSPIAVAAIGLVLLVATVPSYSRFKFERDVQAMLAQNPQVKVIAMAQYGDLTEPITWFHAPIGFVHTVGPNSPIEGGYRRVILRYDEDPVVTFENPDCDDGTIWISTPDSEGLLRYTAQAPDPMSAEDSSSTARQTGALSRRRCSRCSARHHQMTSRAAGVLRWSGFLPRVD